MLHIPFSCILFLGIIIFVIQRNLSHSFLHPIRLFSFFWVFLVLIASIVWRTEYSWNGLGLLWIELSVIASIGGAYFAKSWFKTLHLAGDSLLDVGFDEEKLYWRILYVFIAISFLSVIITIILNGFSFSNFLSLDSILDMNAIMNERRNDGSEKQTAIVQLISVFNSAAVLVSGYAFAITKNKKRRLICLTSVLPIVLSVVFSTVKSEMIATTILFLAGWAVSKYSHYGDIPRIKLKAVFGIIIALGLVLALLFFAMLMRVGGFTTEIVDVIRRKYLVYGFGQMVNFDAWFSSGEGFFDYGLGANTYMVIPRLLGLTHRVAGVYELSTTGYGNVYSAFRGIVSDFGVIGGLIYAFFRGLICQVSLSQARYKSYSGLIFRFLVACQYFFGLYGFIISPWVYTTYVLTLIFFFVFICGFERRVVIFGKQIQ